MKKWLQQIGRVQGVVKKWLQQLGGLKVLAATVICGSDWLQQLEEMATTREG